MIARLQDLEPRIRAMHEKDLPRIVAIESSAYPYPWSKGIFRDCLRVNYQCRVVEWEETVVGYGIMSLGANEAHILNLCIHPGFRRRGLGRLMLRDLLQTAVQHEAHAAYLEVRPSNSAAIGLYESDGFMLISTRRGYYQAPGGREDALVFKKALGDRH